MLRHVAAGSGSRFWRGSATVTDLQTLLGRFIGPERANESFAAYARSQGINGVEQLTANAVLVHYVESQIAGAIGSASARVMVASVVEEEQRTSHYFLEMKQVEVVQVVLSNLSLQHLT